MTRSVFYGFGAFVGSLTGPTSCGFWPDDPALLGWAPAKQIPVDLGKNPEAVRRGLIKPDEIQADDYAGYSHGGLTQIGPMWPGGRMTGACWLESSYWSGLGASKPARIPPGFQSKPYEHTSVLYWDGPLAGRRFIGAHGEIRQRRGTTHALVALWEIGSSQIPGQAPFGTFWIDFPAHAHAIEPDLTEIGLGPNDPQRGAVFLDSQLVTAMRLSLRKAPQSQGGMVFQKRRPR
jgi:hypothetical protein